MTAEIQRSQFLGYLEAGENQKMQNAAADMEPADIWTLYNELGTVRDLLALGLMGKVAERYVEAHAEAPKPAPVYRARPTRQEEDREANLKGTQPKDEGRASGPAL